MFENIELNQSLFTTGVFAFTVLLTFLIARIADRIFKRLIEVSSLDLHNDPTNYRFVRHGIMALIYVVGLSLAIYQVPQLRVVARSLLAGAGLLAVAVGFAAQHALSNVISGVFLVVFKPFRINDRLQVKGLSGIVEDITLRHTVIRDFENKRIIIPNAVISDEVIINSDHSDEEKCKFINISISYQSDIKKAKSVIRNEIINHPLFMDRRTEEQKQENQDEAPVRVIELGEYAINLRAWAWAKDSSDAFVMGCDLYESIKTRFDEEGIEIPYPTQVYIQRENSN